MLKSQVYFFYAHGSHFGFFASTALQLVLHCRWLANSPEVGIANIAIISKIVNVNTNFYQCFFQANASLLIVLLCVMNTSLCYPLPVAEAEPMTGVEMYMGTMMAAALLAKGVSE